MVCELGWGREGSVDDPVGSTQIRGFKKEGVPSCSNSLEGKRKSKESGCSLESKTASGEKSQIKWNIKKGKGPSQNLVTTTEGVQPDRSRRKSKRKLGEEGGSFG